MRRKMECRGLKRKRDDDDSLSNKKRLIDKCEGDNICTDEFTEAPRLIEPDVGITQRVNHISPYSGIIKQRYSDFVVNEIDSTNEVVRLSELSIPRRAPEIMHDAVKNLGDDVVHKLHQILDSPESEEAVTIKVNDKSKEERTKIHQTIRQHFTQFQSSTEDRNGDKVILIQHSKHLQGNQRKNSNWPPNQPNYLQFVMYKENRDTMEAINSIAKALRLKTSSFTYSGVKDKRAKTSQLVTVYRVLAEKIATLKIRGITFGNYKYVDSPLQLGDLNGNRFKIVLRKLIGDGDCEKIINNLKTNGFINYYGMQRFGTSTIPTHHIGKALLLGNWKEAIELILKPRSGENEQLTECRKFWWETRNAKEAYKKIPIKYSIEGHLLRGLSENNPNDYVNALNAIPRNSRLMYIHSYQSYLWNRIVSERIRKFGLQVLNGDLYLQNTSSDSQSKKRNSDTPQVYNSENEFKLKIVDVVMPLPGSSIKIPENEVSTIYEDILREECIDFGKSYSNVKTYALHGSYRKIIVQPQNVSWNILKYNDLNSPLVLSDLDLLDSSKSQPSSIEDGVNTALCIEFSLPPSSYATMALREVIYVDTSPAAQTCLN